MGKPVFVFDQKDGNWYTFIDNKFVITETPVLTPKFAGIGTREITDIGIQAIEDVYSKTISTIKESEKIMIEDIISEEDLELDTTSTQDDTKC